MTGRQCLGGVLGVIQYVTDAVGGYRQSGCTVGAHLGVGDPRVGCAPAVGGQPGRVIAGCAVHIALGQFHGRSASARGAVAHATGFQQLHVLRVCNECRRVIHSRHIKR